MRCLFDLILLSDFGGKWPLKWKCSKRSSWFIDGTPNYVSWPNLVKIGRRKVAKRSHGLPNKKTRARRDSSQPSFWPKSADRAQNSLNVVTPWLVHVYRIGSGSAAFCRTYSGKIDFSAQKVNTINRLSAYYNQLEISGLGLFRGPKCKATNFCFMLQ